MKHRMMAIFPPEFRKDPVHFRALGLAFVYVTMAILQLFTFEDFAEVTSGFGLPGGQATAIVIALLLPVAEITALPYLLSMRLPRIVHRISRLSVLVAAGLWVAIALWTNLSGNTHTNLGIFGATLYTPNQWWSVIFVGLLAWAAWLVYASNVSRTRQASRQGH